MYRYDWYHWITFFYIYCFFGWIFESTYVSLKKRHFVNRGFLRLPMLPLYGTGAVMMLWVSLPVKDNLFLVYLFGVIAATALEYVTGYVMEQLFKMKYWDYSSQRLQINGYICLTSSIAWGFLTIFLTEIIHQPVASLVLALNPVAEYTLLAVVTCFFGADVIQSTKEALALGKVLEAMTNIKTELEEMQVQLALFKAEATQKADDLREKAENFKDDARLQIQTLTNDARLRTEYLKNELKQATSRHAAILREEAATHLSLEPGRELSSLSERIRFLTERQQQLRETRLKLSSHMSFYRKGLLKGNPSASSGKFAEALKELREILEKED